MADEAFISEWRPRFGVWVLVKARPQAKAPSDRDVAAKKPSRAELSPAALRDLYTRR